MTSIAKDNRMSIEANKALITKVCNALDTRDVPTLLSCMHEDGSWSVPYRQDKFQFAGHKDKAAFAELIAFFLGGFSEFSYKVTAMAAEGDLVFIEAKSSGIGPGGATYNHVYAKSFRIKDGLVFEAREFFDPFEVLAYVEQWPAQ